MPSGDVKTLSLTGGGATLSLSHWGLLAKSDWICYALFDMILFDSFAISPFCQSVFLWLLLLPTRQTDCNQVGDEEWASWGRANLLRHFLLRKKENQVGDTPTGDAPSGWNLRRKPPRRNASSILTDLQLLGMMQAPSAAGSGCSATPECDVAPKCCVAPRVWRNPQAYCNP